MLWRHPTYKNVEDKWCRGQLELIFLKKEEDWQQKLAQGESSSPKKKKQEDFKSFGKTGYHLKIVEISQVVIHLFFS